MVFSAFKVMFQNLHNNFSLSGVELLNMKRVFWETKPSENFPTCMSSEALSFLISHMVMSSGDSNMII